MRSCNKYKLVDSRILKELLIETCEGAFTENQKESLKRWYSGETPPEQTS